MIDHEVERRHARARMVDGAFRFPHWSDVSGQELAFSPRPQSKTVLGELDPTSMRQGCSRGSRSPGAQRSHPGDPPTIFDAAHNPDGARALAESLPTLTEEREVVCCLADPRGEGRDRDRRRARAGCLALRLHGDPAGADRGLGPARRARAAGAGARGALREGRGGGGGDSGPARRLGASTRACQGEGGGRAGGRQPLPSGCHMDREARSELLTMMGLVAVVVAVVILVFFALGYVFGLLFL